MQVNAIAEGIPSKLFYLVWIWKVMVWKPSCHRYPRTVQEKREVIFFKWLCPKPKAAAQNNRNETPLLKPTSLFFLFSMFLKESLPIVFASKFNSWQWWVIHIRNEKKKKEKKERSIARGSGASSGVRLLLGLLPTATFRGFGSQLYVIHTVNFHYR